MTTAPMRRRKSSVTFDRSVGGLGKGSSGDDLLFGPGSQVSHRLGYLFKHAGMRVEELNASALSPLGIDARELGVLLVLTAHEHISQQQVAQRLGIDRTTMVALLDTLERKGLVSRHPRAQDRRSDVVELTDTGRQVLHDGTQASDDAASSLLAPRGARQQRLRDALHRLLTHPASTRA